MSEERLSHLRVLAAINGTELFGHERGNIEVFKALRAQGAEVSVGVNARGGATGEHLRDLGFHTVDIPFGAQWSLKWLKLNGPSYAVQQLQAAWRSSRVFTRAITDFKPTHLHLGNELAYSFLWLALQRSKLPLIWRMGDCPPTDSKFNMPSWKSGMKRASRIVPNSRFVLNEAVAAGAEPKKCRVIHNLAPTSTTSGGPRPPKERAIVYVGSISEHKGLLPLVEAFAKVRVHHSDLQLWLVGGSQYDTEFRAQLRKRCDELGISAVTRFIGHVGNTSDWFAAAALHVAPSLWEEPFANVVLEAKRAGIPSVVFNTGGMAEMVRDGLDGVVCPEKTAACLAEGMLKSLETADSLGAAAAVDSENRFGEARFLKDWGDIYLEA
jgi:glycosyltransferase involved in cell wall biosynthesis